MKTDSNNKFPREKPLHSSFILIDELQDNQPRGRIQNEHFPCTFSFCGLSEIVFTLNEICNALKCPQASFQLRTFHSPLPRPIPVTREERIAQEAAFREAVKQVYPGSIMQGKLRNFAVEIIFRQNGSLQGCLIILDKKQTMMRHFRSSLELEYLLADALNILPKPVRFPF